MTIQIPNTFRQKILAKQTLIGFWMNMSSHITAELAGMIGFDWLLLDGEHSPNEVPMFLNQLQALSASGSAAVGRPPANDPVIIKRFLDIGFYNLLIPFIESREEAELAVAATRYPPQGMRGVSGSTRANGFGATKEFFSAVNDNITVLLQIESQKGIDAVDEIAAVPGVDGIFIGPSDLAASLGHIGDPNHPHVQEVIKHLHARSIAAGKAVGILAPGKDDAQRYLDMGMHFVAVGVDLSLFKQSMAALQQHFHNYVQR